MFKLIHLPTLKTFKYSEQGDVLDSYQKHFLTERYLKGSSNIFLSVWVFDEDFFLLGKTKICENDLEISPVELAWLEYD